MVTTHLFERKGWTGRNGGRERGGELERVIRRWRKSWGGGRRKGRGR